jgi:LuxR family transcriptional regulator, maltose regulon positive regulatory protein
MMMTPLQESADLVDHAEHHVSRTGSTTIAPANARVKSLHLFAEKLRVPPTEGAISRERLDELLERSCAQFGATLISGRAGTGKTIVAAGFATRYRNVAWLSIESADSDWEVFSHYLNAALIKTNVFGATADVSIFERAGESPREEVSHFVTDLFSQGDTVAGAPLLIVLDNIQHLFDASWFNDFFTQLLHSLPPHIHLLMLCRSKPPLPLWRLRSKQRLNVIDEKLLTFSPEEAERLFEGYGIARDVARSIHSTSYGRAAKLARFLESRSI